MRSEIETRKLAAIWSLRATLRPKAFDNFSQHSPSDACVLRLAGLENLIQCPVSDGKIKALLQHQLKEIETPMPSRRGPLFQSVDRLGKMMGLTTADQEIFLFALLIGEEEGLEQAIDNLGMLSMKQLARELSHILKIKPADIVKGLHRSAPLSSSGLLRVGRGNSLGVTQRLELLDGLSSDALEEGLNKTFSQYFYEGRKTRLGVGDFSHLRKDLDILYPFLGKALKERSPGVNILIYGPPGTGKTELARLVAGDLGADLYEVGSEDDDGDPAARNRRFRSYLLCQKLFSHTSNCLILFDEVEDVFPESDFAFFGPRRSGDYKGWTNRLLENNPVPAIWITNGIHQIDNAFIRRFDMVFEVPTPPRSVRKRILGQAIGTLSVDEARVERAACNDHLAPSHIEKAVKVMSMAGLEGEAALDQLITNAHRAMGYPKRHIANLQPYDLQLLNTSHDLGALAETLSEIKGARICLYGPPGSGKTAFVHYLAGRLERPVLLKRASDLLGSYVGDTEQSIAAMFDEARTEGTVLLLDEADSFLQDRGRAHRSWEITQVNELLVQMESYEGLFFCATNFMDVLDSAVFRRFDLKVKFDYLSIRQVIDLFMKCLDETGVSLDEKEAWSREVSSLRHLTPGDFVTAQRQLKLSGRPVTAEDLFKALLIEQNAQSGRSRRPAGFAFEGSN
jgi:SpoVK/Ycf46/Vps4 family AAA+-type ATPase